MAVVDCVQFYAVLADSGGSECRNMLTALASADLVFVVCVSNEVDRMLKEMGGVLDDCTTIIIPSPKLLNVSVYVCLTNTQTYFNSTIILPDTYGVHIHQRNPTLRHRTSGQPSTSCLPFCSGRLREPYATQLCLCNTSYNLDEAWTYPWASINPYSKGLLPCPGTEKVQEAGSQH